MHKIWFAMVGLFAAAVAQANALPLPADFRWLDANADGYLDHGELPRGCVLARQFALFDLDHDNLLDAAELTRAEQIMHVRLLNRLSSRFLNGEAEPEPKLVAAPDGFIEGLPSH